MREEKSKLQTLFISLIFFFCSLKLALLGVLYLVEKYRGRDMSSASPEPPVSPTQAIGHMTVANLRRALSARGLEAKGVKTELVARLEAYFQGSIS